MVQGQASVLLNGAGTTTVALMTGLARAET